MKNTLKNKNKNLKLTTLGFTLIELLAVIVILAIIALIATPIILGIVEDARKDSFLRSVELVIKTTDIDIFGKEYNDTYTYTIKDGVVSNLEVGVKNTEGMNGNIVYDTKGLEQYAIYNGKYCVIKTSTMKKAEIKDYKEGECILSMIIDEKYFIYEELEDNKIEIIGYSFEGPKDVIIPEEIDGKKVVSIGNFAFSNMSLTSVVLPKTLVKIGYSAFSTNLVTDITLPNSVEEVDDYAFCYNNLSQTSINNIAEMNEYAYCTVTDEDCFIYKDVELVEYEIVDVEACIQHNINEWGYSDDATSICNNELGAVEGVRFTDFLKYGSLSQESINLFKQEGGVAEARRYSAVEITGYKCSETDVVIPNRIDNKEVFSIASGAFVRYGSDLVYLNNSTIRPINNEFVDGPDIGIITSIVLPDSIVKIETEAFAFNKISRLKLSSGLLFIAAEAFKQNLLTTVILPNTPFSQLNIGNYSFAYNDIGDVISPYDDIYVGNYSFCASDISTSSEFYQKWANNEYRTSPFVCGPY